MTVLVWRKRAGRKSKQVKGKWSIDNNFPEFVILSNDKGDLLAANKSPKANNSLVNYVTIF